VLHAARWKKQDAKITQKNRRLRTIAQFCTVVSSTIRRKLVKQLYLLHTSSQYAELWPTNSWYRLASLASWLRYCTDIAQCRSTRLSTRGVRNV